MREYVIGRVALLAGLLALMCGFSLVVQGTDWRTTVAKVMVAVALVCGVQRLIRIRARFLIGTVAVAWLLALEFAASTLTYGLPTLATVDQLGAMLREAWTLIVQDPAPIDPSEPIVLVLAAGGGLAVGLADQIADARMGRGRIGPALVGGLMAVMLAVPSVIDSSQPLGWVFVTASVAWLVVLWLAHDPQPQTRQATGARLGSVQCASVLCASVLCAVVALTGVSFAPSATPGAAGGGPSSTTMNLFGRGIDPMIELGKNLRRNSPVQALTYTTTAERPLYMKLATLHEFTGRTWRPSRFDGFPPPEGPLAIGAGVDVEENTTTITLDGLRTRLLPMPYAVTSDVTGPDGDWVLQRSGLTVTAPRAQGKGQTYTVEHMEPRPSSEQMRAQSTRLGREYDPYLQLPDGLPDVIASTAQQVTQEADAPFEKMQALQNWFRNSGGFTYSETAPVDDGYDGDSMEIIARFLEAKAGYCVHFASSMAVMARTLGVPSRVAVGYAPGDRLGLVNDELTFAASSDDLHAWVEVYLQGAGWVRFDPTTGIGSGTSFASEGQDQAATPAPSASTPTPEPTQATPQSSEQTQAADEQTPAAAGSRWWIALAVVLALAVAPSIRAVRRARRLRRADAMDFWAELTDQHVDWGGQRDAASTPRQQAATFTDQYDADESAVGRLLAAVEDARFGPQPGGTQPDALRADYRQVSAAMRAHASLGPRVSAWLLPRSLIR